jgi:hypothetical protein
MLLQGLVAALLPVPGTLEVTQNVPWGEGRGGGKVGCKYTQQHGGSEEVMHYTTQHCIIGKYHHMACKKYTKRYTFHP